MNNQTENFLPCKELVNNKIGKCILEETVILKSLFGTEESWCECPRAKKEPWFRETIDKLVLYNLMPIFCKNLLYDILPKKDTMHIIYTAPIVELPKGAILTRDYETFNKGKVIFYPLEPSVFLRTDKLYLKFELPDFINDDYKEECKCHYWPILNPNNSYHKHDQEIVWDTVDNTSVDQYNYSDVRNIIPAAAVRTFFCENNNNINNNIPE